MRMRSALSIQRSEKLVVARPASAPKCTTGRLQLCSFLSSRIGSAPACFVSPYPLDLRVVGRRARRAALLRIPLLCYLPPPRCNRRLRLPRFPRLESLLVKGKVYAAMYELSSDDEACVLTVGITPAIFLCFWIVSSGCLRSVFLLDQSDETASHDVGCGQVRWTISWTASS
jgi:hypothetical protein